MSSDKPHLLHILNAAMQDWIPERRKDLIKQYRQDRSVDDDEDMAYQLEQTIKEEYFQRIVKLIYSDQGIDR